MSEYIILTYEYEYNLNIKHLTHFKLGYNNIYE